VNKDIRITVSLPDHHKTIKLVRKAGEGAFRCLLRLWCYAAEHRPHGVLYGMDATDIAIASGWGGDEEEWVNALASTGWMDRQDGELTLHDWEEHNPYAFHAEARSEKARNAAKAKWAKRNAATSNATSMNEDSWRQSASNAPSPAPTPSPTTTAVDANKRDAIRESLDSIGTWNDPNCAISGGRVLEWVRQGADLDLDILPTLKAVTERKRKRDGPQWMPRSLVFYDDAIANAIASRTRPLPEGKPNAQPTPGQPQSRIDDVETRRRRTAESIRRVMASG
jgi:hypothetical protein